MESKEKLFGKWNEIVLLLLGFALTSIIGTIITYQVQQRSYYSQHQQAITENENEQSFKVFQDLSDIMDKRVYKMRRIIWAYQGALPAEKVQKRWDDYAILLEDWNDHINKNFALLNRYFGENERAFFEQKIHNQFRNSGSYLEKYKNISEIDMKDKIIKMNADSLLLESKDILDKVNVLIYYFDINLLQKIKAKEDSTLKYRY